MPQTKSYLKVVLLERKSKTEVYGILNLQNTQVGIVKWYPAWRRYVFLPGSDMIFDSSCLSEITTFINRLMEERK